MTASLELTVSNRNYPPDPRVSVEQYVHEKIGCTVGTAHQWIAGIIRVNKRTAVIVEAMVQTHQPQRADRWLAEVFQARQGLLPLELSEAVIMQAVDADHESAKARNYYRATKTRESLVEYRRRLKIKIAEKMRLLKAIETELEA